MPSDSDVEFGQIAVRHKLITRKQHDEAFKVLKKLKGQLKRTGKLKKKQPRLVDVLVQQDMLSGSEAKSVENARKFRQIRLDDKLYARIALKSKFCKQRDIKDGLDKQKKRYLGGKSPKRLAEFLISKGTLSDEEDEAIQEVISKLDAREYVARDRGRPSDDSEIDLEDEDDDDDSGLEEIDDDDLEEIDDDDLEEVDVDELSGSGIDLDLDDDEEVESLENDSEVDELDSVIDVRLSGLDGDIDELSDVSDVDHRNDTKTPAPRGLSSDMDLDDDDDDDLDLDDDEVDLGDDDDDDDAIDLDDLSDDDDDDDDDDSLGSDIDDLDLDDLD